MLELRVLGRMELSGGEDADLDSILRRPKRLAILAYLCIAGRGDFVRRDVLLALFWPDSDPDRARSSLSQSLYVLRRALGAAGFRATEPVLREVFRTGKPHEEIVETSRLYHVRRLPVRRGRTVTHVLSWFEDITERRLPPGPSAGEIPGDR